MEILKEHVEFLCEPFSKPMLPWKLAQLLRGPSGKSIETLREIGAPQLTARSTLLNTTAHNDETYVCSYTNI